MFHVDRDASKVALGGASGEVEPRWRSPAVGCAVGDGEHLRSLGAVEIPRSEYLSRLKVVVKQPSPPWSD